MFTGIVEDLGEVEALEHLGDFARIHVRSTVVTEDARVGDSICVSGVCLTVTGLITSRPTPADTAPAGTAQPDPSPAPLGFTADVMGETLRHSSLKSLAPGTKVNLERSVRLEDRLAGPDFGRKRRTPHWRSYNCHSRPKLTLEHPTDASHLKGGPQCRLIRWRSGFRSKNC